MIQYQDSELLRNHQQELDHQDAFLSFPDTQWNLTISIIPENIANLEFLITYFFQWPEVNVIKLFLSVIYEFLY